MFFVNYLRKISARHDWFLNYLQFMVLKILQFRIKCDFQQLSKSISTQPLNRCDAQACSEKRGNLLLQISGTHDAIK